MSQLNLKVSLLVVLVLVVLGLSHQHFVAAERYPMSAQPIMTHFEPILGMPIFGRIIGGALGIEAERADIIIETAYEGPSAEAAAEAEFSEGAEFSNEEAAAE